VTTRDDEDKLLRSVALKNANSILAARQRAEQRSEAYLAEAQKLSHTGSFGWRPSTGEILWSAETYRIFQYDQVMTPTVELILRRVHAQDAPCVRQTIERASDDGKDFEHEYRLVMPDHSVKHVHVVARTISNESGSIEFVGAVMDVTEQHQAKAALENALDEIKKSQDRLRLVIDTIPSMVWSARPDGSVDFVNQPWMEYHGLTLEDFGRPGVAGRVVHPGDVAESADKWHAALAAGTSFEHELRVRRADGEYRWFLSRAVPLRDEFGNIAKWYGTITDIEDRKRAEMMLTGEKRLLEMMARGDSRAVIHDALCKLLEELASGSLSSILLLEPNTGCLRHGAAPSLPTSYTEAIDGAVIGPSAGSCGTAAYRAEPVIVSDIATDPLWADYRDLALAHGLRACWSNPILSSRGRVLGTVATYYREPRSPTAQEQEIQEQITHLASIAIEREQVEEALRKAHADLAHGNRVTTMGELSASLAHEVNQPLVGVVTGAEACLRWLNRATPNLEEVRRNLGRIIKDGHRASEVIQRIRALSKKTDTQKAPLDINEVINEVIALVQRELFNHRVSLRTELAPTLPAMLGDRIQLQQVIINLVVNGIEAMQPVTDRSRELVIGSQQDGSQQLLVTVKDCGVGIPAENAVHLFKAFFTTKTAGMGMGLSICRSIVEAHGGQLWATANASHGATFQFTLPVRAKTVS
jgi:PAS domain S-box-containing protein